MCVGPWVRRIEGVRGGRPATPCYRQQEPQAGENHCHGRGASCRDAAAPSGKPDKDEGVEGEAGRQRHEGEPQKPRGQVDEPTGNAAALGLPMVGRRSHDKAHSQRDEKESSKVYDLLLRAQDREALVEHRNELKPHKRLDARQHHASLVRGVSGFLFEALAMDLLHHVSRPGFSWQQLRNLTIRHQKLILFMVS